MFAHIACVYDFDFVACSKLALYARIIIFVEMDRHAVPIDHDIVIVDIIDSTLEGIGDLYLFRDRDLVRDLICVLLVISNIHRVSDRQFTCSRKIIYSIIICNEL